MDEPFLRFVNAVRRRMRVVRALEGMGVGALAGSVIGLLVMGVLIWRGDESRLVGAAMVALGATIGLAWGAMLRVNPLSAAMQADRQLGLRDLLGTALCARNSDDPWARSVVAIAAHRCADLNPRQVLLNRLGARAWGGIATAAMLALAVAALAPQAAPTLANDAGRSFIAARDLDRLEAAAPPALPRTAPQAPARPADRDRPTAIPMHSDDPADATPQNASVESPHHTEIANPQGAGGGEGHTDTAHDPQRLAITPSQGSHDPENGIPGDTGDAGHVTRDSEPGDIDPLGSHVAADPGAPIAPWMADNWNATRRAAMDAIQEDQIPAEYRDLVRAYFSRHEDRDE